MVPLFCLYSTLASLPKGIDGYMDMFNIYKSFRSTSSEFSHTLLIKFSLIDIDALRGMKFFRYFNILLLSA